MHTLKYLFFPYLNKKAERKRGKLFSKVKSRQGPQNIIKEKLYEIVLSFKVTLFSLFSH